MNRINIDSTQHEIQSISCTIVADTAEPSQEIPFYLLPKRKSNLPLTGLAGRHNYGVELLGIVNHSNTISGGLNVSSRGTISGITVLPDGTLSSYAVPALTNSATKIVAYAMQRLYGGSGHVLSFFRPATSLVYRPSADHDWSRTKPDKRWSSEYQGSKRMKTMDAALFAYTPPTGQRFWADETMLTGGAVNFATNTVIAQNGIVLSDKNVFKLAGTIHFQSFSATVNAATGYVFGKAKVFLGAPVSLTYRGFYSPAVAKVLGTGNSTEDLWRFSIIPGPIPL